MERSTNTGKQYFAVSHLAQLSPIEVHKLYRLRALAAPEGSRVQHCVTDNDLLNTTLHIMAWNEHDVVASTRLRPSTWNDFITHVHSAKTIDTSLFAPEQPVRWLSHIRVHPEWWDITFRDEELLPSLILTETLRLAHGQFAGQPVVALMPHHLVDVARRVGFRALGSPATHTAMIADPESIEKPKK